MIEIADFSLFMIFGSIVSGTVGAILGSAQQEKASQRDRKNVLDTNTVNLALAMMGRGAPIQFNARGKPIIPESVSGAEAAILPYYFGDAEKRLGESAVGSFDALQALAGSPRDEAMSYQELIDQFGPAILANENLARAIASGEISEDMLRESEPVYQARMDVAESKKNAGLEALKETINQIDAIQARRGFTGDSFGNRMLKFNARRNIFSQAASDVGEAKLANAMEKRATQEAGRNLRLNNINLPDALARAGLARKILPTATAGQRFQTAMAPFQFFNLGPHDFSAWQNPPPTAVNPSPWQLAAQAGSATGTSAANYFLQRDLQNRALSNARRNDYSWLAGTPYASSGGATGAGFGSGGYMGDVDVTALAGIA